MVSPNSTSEEFQFAYALTKSAGGTYTLVDANPGQSGVQPIAIGVDLVDPQGNGAGKGKLTIDSIASGSLSSTGGKYTFVATADLGTNGSGFIVKDANGDFFYLTDTAYSGTLNGHKGELSNLDTNANPLL